MSTYHLKSVFRPKSVAVVGGATRPRSIGRALVGNLVHGGFAGPLALVNPNAQPVDGIQTVARLKQLGWAPDLVLIATPAAVVPRIAAEAADCGAGAVAVLTAAMGHGRGSPMAQLHAIGRERGLRILGPNCLGVINPHMQLNASLARHSPQAGDIALISQSGAISAGLVEWSLGRSIGFSSVVSLGDALDVDFGDLLDYFATDPKTRAILLYVEAIHDARKFMSAARAAARIKPVVVMKARQQGYVLSDNGHEPQIGDDAVYDAAFRRAGLLRVHSLDELFAAAETLGRLHAVPGRRLGVLTNGGGVGALSADRLVALGGSLADLSSATVARLDSRLPVGWSRTNPVDLLTDIDAERYADTLGVLLDDADNDALLAVNVPTVLSSSVESAQALIDAWKARPTPRKPVLAVWLGNDPAATGLLNAAGIPNYPNESDAVDGFMHLVRHHEAQVALMETPPSLPRDFVVDAASARAVVEDALAAGQRWLDPLSVHRLLTAYGIPLAPLALARDPDEAAELARAHFAGGNAVVVKLASTDIAHKSDVDGVRLNLTGEIAVRDAATAILARAHARRPDARIDGVLVQPMVVRPKARELVAGLIDDPVFGPVVSFGRGGTAADVINDRALALPPLDLRLARELIERTRVSRILKAYRDVPAADERAIELVLVKLAQLAADLPEVRELDINPLLADREGVIAVDARVRVGKIKRLHKGRSHPRFSILPYPQEWERSIDLSDGRHAFVWPVRPEDEDLFRAFFEHVTQDDLRLRFFRAMRHFSHEFIARLTQLDYARSIALLAIEPASGEMLGAVRLHADADYDKGEYGVLVRSDLKGLGIGWQLMSIMIECAQWLGLNQVEGQVLRENGPMLAMCEQLGFKVRSDPDDLTVALVTLDLHQSSIKPA